MSMSDGLNAREDAISKRLGLHRMLTVVADTSELKRMSDMLTKSKEGRKAARNSAKASLRVFNIYTGIEASKLKLKKSGKNWRKTLTKKGSYRYKTSARTGGVVSATTFINYKKAVLKISHLVEEGFKHFKLGKISGHWFRKNAFDNNYKKVQRIFLQNMQYSYNHMLRTGRAPTESKLARRYGS